MFTLTPLFTLRDRGHVALYNHAHITVYTRGKGARTAQLRCWSRFKVPWETQRWGERPTCDCVRVPCRFTRGQHGRTARIRACERLRCQQPHAISGKREIFAVVVCRWLQWCCCWKRWVAFAFAF